MRRQLAGAAMVTFLFSACTPGPPAAVQPNLWAQAVEVTQATQTWLPVNTKASIGGGTPPTFSYPGPPTAMPLVANRATAVRVYAGVAGATKAANARAELRCFSGPSFNLPCPPPFVLNPLNGQRTLRQDDSLDDKRKDAALTWNFVLPRSWTVAGTVSLEAAVLPPSGLVECVGCDDAANRIRVSGMKFEAIPGFTSMVHLVRVRRQLGGKTFEPTQAEMAAHVNFLKARYPVDELTLPQVPDDTWLWADDASAEDRCGRVLPDLQKAYANRANKLSVYAVVDADFPCSGRGFLDGGYAYGNAPSEDSFAHEVGHAVGLKHAGPPPGHGPICPLPGGGNCAECKLDSWCDNDWPWPHGTIGAYGFDPFTQQVYYPGTTEADPHDFMSYGGMSEWVSPRTWTRIFSAFKGFQLPIILKGPSAHGDSMEPGEMLKHGESVTSPNGKYTLIFQTDANLVLYRNADGHSPWASETEGKPAGEVIMQKDGNLVMYDTALKKIWSTGTSDAGSRLVIQDDGNVVLYRPAGGSVWSTETAE